MSATPRLLEITTALAEARIACLIMGGHAVRHYGVDRNTFDFDFSISLEDAAELQPRLERTRLFSRQGLTEGAGWRRADFRRFQIGVLHTGREEWLGFWFRNHLLAPFPELYARREEMEEAGRRLSYHHLLQRRLANPARHAALIISSRKAAETDKRFFLHFVARKE